MKKLFPMLSISAFFLLVCAEVQAASASLYLSPQSGTFTVGSTFDVSIFLNTGGENVTAIRVNLKFDPQNLQVITPVKGLSAVGEWIFPPSFSNSNGEISLQGGFPTGVINTSEGLISQIVFEAITSGKTEINFLDSSQILAGKEGVNILTSVNRGAYDVILAPPKGPKIFSESHADQNKWSKNNSPVFSWEKVSGNEGYSYSLDEDPYGEPDNIVDTQDTAVFLERVEDGIRYFHLKAKRGQVWGGTSHFRVMIDATLPEFQPNLETFSLISGNYLLIDLNGQDLLSGIDHYEMRITDLTHPENVLVSGWIRQESPLKFTTERSGTFRILMRAFDNAGNFKEEKIQAKVLNSSLVLIGKGVQIMGLFLPWWLIIFFPIIILIIAGYFALKRAKRKSALGEVNLEKEIKEAEKEIEDVRIAEEKLRKIRMMEEEAKKESARLADKLRAKSEK